MRRKLMPDWGFLDQLRPIVLAVFVTISMFSGTIILVGGVAGNTGGGVSCGSVTYDGSGTTSDPYKVSTASQLQCIEEQGLDSNYVLTSDINLDEPFNPIGNDSTPFTGEFNGTGHTISDLNISQPSTDDIGLFGVSEGRIEQVTLSNVSVTGGDNVGALAGDQTGNVVNVSASGTVSGGDNVGGLVGRYDGTSNIDMTQSSAAVNVTGNANVGGLIGFTENAEQSITYSSASGSVTGDHNVGGLVGLADYFGGTANMYWNYASGDVEATGSQGNVGGLVGKSAAGRIQESYATGNVTGARRVGGLVGVQKDNAGGYGAGISDSYANGTVNGGSKTGGLVGRSAGTVRTSYAAGDVIDGTTVGGLVGDNDARVVESHWDTQATGVSSGAGEGSVASSTSGLRTSAMQDRNAHANMSKFDFLQEWAIRANDYPALAWQGVPPLISQVEATNPSGQKVAVSFNSTRALSDISVSLSGPGTSKTFTTYDFAVSKGSYRGPMIYTLDSPIDVGSSGTYTISIDTAKTDEGGNGATGQTDTVSVGQSTPEPDATVSPGTIDYGSVSVGSTATETVTVTNAGTADLDVTDASISGADASEFAVDWGGQTVLAPSESTTVTVEFTPSAGGTNSADLTIANNDSDVTVPLTGTGFRSPPYFTVTIDSTTSPAIEGENLTVDAVIENLGGQTGTSTVTLSTGGTEHDSTSVTVEGGTSETVTLSWATASGDAGRYTATVQSTDSGGTTDTAKRAVTVTAAQQSPSAAFDRTPQNPETGQIVTLDASNTTDPTDDIVTYEWDFRGDGTWDETRSGPTTTTTYSVAGTHTIRLRVTDDDGNTDTEKRTIQVDPGAPNATFTASPSTTAVGESITLDASNTTDPTGDIVEYEWDFRGDGTWDETRSAPTTTTAYSVAGTHTIRLRVTDEHGTTRLASRTVTVERKPPTVELTAADANTSAKTPPMGQTIYTNGTMGFEVAANGRPGSVASASVGLDATFTNFEHTVDATHQSGETWTATADLSSLPDDGTYGVSVSAVDDSGNRNETVTNVTVDLDRRAPALGTTVTRLGGGQASVNVTADEPLKSPPTITVEKPDGTTETATIVDSGDGYWNATVSRAGPGQYNVTATGTDRAGNHGTGTATTYFETVQTQDDTAMVVLQPSGLFVNFTTDVAVTDTVVMTESNTALAPLASRYSGLNFLNAKLGPVLSGNLSHAVVGIPVNTSTLPSSVAKTDVEIRYYNETSGNWDRKATRVETRSVGGVTGEYWIANVTHFSTYGAVVDDDKAPTIDDTTPSGDLPAATTSQSIRFDYSDATSGIDASMVTVTFNGADVTDAPTTTISGEYATYRATGLEAGSHTASVTVHDEAGNVRSADTTFTIPVDGGDGDNGGDGDEHGGGGETDDGTDVGGNIGGNIGSIGSGADSEGDESDTTNGSNIPTIGERRIERLTGSGTATVELPNESRISVVEVDLESGGRVNATAVGALPSDTSHPDGVALGVVDLEVREMATDSVPVRLAVSSAAIDETGARPADLVVEHRSENGTWSTLPTTVVDQNGSRVTVEASVTDFSLFAVTAPNQSSTTTPTPTPTPTSESGEATATATATPMSEPTEAAPTTTTAVEAGGGSINWSMIGGAVVLFVLVGALLGARSRWT